MVTERDPARLSLRRRSKAERRSDAEQMERLEQRVLARLGIPDPYR